MNSQRLLSGFVLMLFFMATDSQAKEWRGIVPLHSTRADVERLLGQPNSRYERYAFENEEAQITYSGDTCATGWNVPRDTVIDIGVTFKTSIKLSDLKIDLARYEIFNDPLVSSHTYYINRDEGIRYEVFNGNAQNKGLILEVYYGSTSEDERLLRCPKATTRSDTKPCPIHTCPVILVTCARGKCVGPQLTFTASIAGGCPYLKPTYKWTISAGKIIKGQGTDTIAVVVRKSGAVPITATVEIGNAIPDTCPRRSSYTSHDQSGHAKR